MFEERDTEPEGPDDPEPPGPPPGSKPTDNIPQKYNLLEYFEFSKFLFVGGNVLATSIETYINARYMQANNDIHDFIRG